MFETALYCVLYANDGRHVAIFRLENVRAIYMDAIRDKIYVLEAINGFESVTHKYTADITIKFENLGFVPCDKIP